MTSSIVDHKPVFANSCAANIILDSFRFLQEQRELKLYAYVIMKTHIHFIASGKDLSEKVRLFKSYTARQIIDLLKDQKNSKILRHLKSAKLIGHTRCEFQLWQEGFHPKQIAGHDMMIQKMEYIHQNPVKSDYVKKPESWRYSSIHNYLGNEALIPITPYRR